MSELSAATRTVDFLWRAALRLVYSLQRLYWFVFRPEQRGVYVAVWVRDRLLLIRLSYMPDATIPSGGLKRGEAPVTAAARELAEEVGIDLRPEALRFAGEFRDCSKYLKDQCHVFEVEFQEEPVVTIDRREVVAAAFRTPEEALAESLAPIVRIYLTQRPGAAPRAVTD
jgi:8-oxo-dGTP pyrophosphatase MutT (NUDIX family)